MDANALLTPTIHIEVRLMAGHPDSALKAARIRIAASNFIKQNRVSACIGEHIVGYDFLDPDRLIEDITVAGYTGPENDTGLYMVDRMSLDVQTYTLKTTSDASDRRRLDASSDDTQGPQVRTLELPHALLKDDWNSLVYDGSLPERLLRCLCRMLFITRRSGLNLRTFNWNRVCLLHGPPGSGKSTLCKALAQKLSIRLSNLYTNSFLVEVDTTSLSSKYFGESGKLITLLFYKIEKLARSGETLVCVMIDEVETIAGSREKASSSGECNDGIRDSAFLDRVDIKQMIPSPSAAAIYNIFRSCVNELIATKIVRTGLVDYTADIVGSSPISTSSEHHFRRKVIRGARRSDYVEGKDAKFLHADLMTEILCFPDMIIRLSREPSSPSSRVWVLAQRCEGLSGRTLRRLPILALAMHTWGGQCSLQDVISAIEVEVKSVLNLRSDQ